MSNWADLSWADRQTLLKRVSAELRNKTPAEEICTKLHITDRIFKNCLRKLGQQAVNITQRMSNELTKEGRQRYEVWKRLNAYQGQRQGFNFE